MSSKQQYKEYNIKLKRNLKDALDQNRDLLNKQFIERSGIAELNKPKTVKNSFNLYSFLLGMLIGGFGTLIILSLF